MLTLPGYTMNPQLVRRLSDRFGSQRDDHLLPMIEGDREQIGQGASDERLVTYAHDDGVERPKMTDVNRTVKGRPTNSRAIGQGTVNVIIGL